MEINWEKLSWLASSPRPWSDERAAAYRKIKDKPVWWVFWGGGVTGWRNETICHLDEG